MFPLLPEDGQAAGAEAQLIDQCEQAAGIVFPADYRALLRATNGFNGYVGRAYLMLWSVPELAELADGYDVFPIAPNRFLIGSDGGTTAYGIQDGRYVSVPFVSACADEISELGTNIGQFIAAIERQGADLGE